MNQHQIIDTEYAAGRVEADTEVRAQAVCYVPDDAIEIGNLAGRIGDRA